MSEDGALKSVPGGVAEAMIRIRENEDLQRPEDPAAAWAYNLAELLAGDAEEFYTVCPYVSVDSTNEVLKRLLAEASYGCKAATAADASGQEMPGCAPELPEGLVIAAAEQTRGKGRLGRSWSSPMGEAAYFSFLLRPACPPERISMLTLLMGLSVAEAVRSLYGLPASIKWPNDVVVDHKKICGILTEAVTDCGPAVIIGTGINVNNETFPDELKEKALSLRQALGTPVPPELVTAFALRNFAGHYRIFLRSFDLAGAMEAYNALLAGRNETVRVEDPSAPYTGIARGIDALGRLAVELPDGSLEHVSSGEVSVRGLYGYI